MIGDPIEIDVMQRQATLVVADDRVGGARDRLEDPESARDPLRERRLPRAERSDEEQDRTRTKPPADSFADVLRVDVGVGGDGQDRSPLS